ncbi:MAG: DUF485 domain-containing protein [Actinomycetes bacterium]
MSTDPAAQTRASGSIDTARYVEAQQSAEFVELRSRLRRFVFPMTIVFMSWYLLYVLASGWARDFMGQKVIGEVNVAYVFGLLQFASTFLIAWLYERFANTRLDPLADKIRGEIEGGR